MGGGVNDTQEGSNGTGAVQRSELLMLKGGGIYGGKRRLWERGITSVYGLKEGGFAKWPGWF